MPDFDLEKESQKQEEPQQSLPLVIEILPGQAGIGLIDIFQPGSYEQKSLRELCDKVLNKRDWGIEDRETLESINRQLDGGILLSKGKTVDGGALEYADVEETEEGEQYFYVPVRAIKPQEGGT